MLNFNKYVHEGEQFVHEVALETNTPWDMIPGGKNFACGFS